MQYFKRQYNYSLKYTHWPCLQAGSASKQMYLPIEVAIYAFFFANSITNTFRTTISMNIFINLLDIPIYSHVIITFILIYMQVCSIVEGQRYSSKLNENQVRNILKLACERPSEREGRTLEVNIVTKPICDFTL